MNAGALRRIGRTALLCTFIALLWAMPVSAAIVITDDMGETVALPAPAQRIVSLAPQNTEILGSLGLMDRVVGVTEFCNYPAEALARPQVGGFSSVSVEKVVALRPDLVLAAPTNGKETVARLRDLGLTVIVLNPDDIGGVFAGIRTVGAATGTATQADSLVQSMQARLAVVRNATACTPNRPFVAHVVWYDPIWVSGNMTYQDEVIRSAGGTNAFAATTGWGTVSLEDFIMKNPDYILVNAGNGMTNETDNADPVYEYFFTDSRLSQISAVREKRIILVNTDTISRGGPRIVDAVEQVAKSIHPECYDMPVQGPAAPVHPLPTQAPGFSGLCAGCGCIVYCMLHRKGTGR